MSGQYWLSFVDPDKEEGTGFLGVAIVYADSAEGAVEVAWELEVNPGGEVLIVGPAPEDTWPLADTNRLLNEEEARRLGGVPES